MLVMGREINMADLKGGFAKTVQKHAGRAKEKVRLVHSLFKAL